MNIRWLASASASCFHATGEMLRGQRLLDAALAEVLAEPVEELRRAAATWQISPAGLVDHLTAVSIESISVEDQARLAIRKLAGEPHLPRATAAVAGWMQHVQSLFLQVHPNAVDELELRSVPLREQWEARGPGVHAMLCKLLGSETLVDAAEVVLVHPVLGGGGSAHVLYNRVSFEAVLANPLAELPEVVRLGWLLAQLQLDLPSIQGNLSRQRALEVGALALVPATLTAAHEVELTGPPEALLQRAIEAWRLGPVDVDAVLAWWETYLTDRPCWSTALAALDRLLTAESA